MSQRDDLKLLCENAVGFSDVSLVPDVVLGLLAELDVSNNVGRALGETLESVCESRDALARVVEQMKVESEALRKDADKWKSVQRAGDQLLADEGRAAIWSACSRILISVASELNSGRSVVTEEGVTSSGAEIGDWRVTVERIDAALGQVEQS